MQVTRAFFSRCCIAALVLVLSSTAAFAHGLGIDQAELVEQSRGEYVLIAKVPESLAHLIAAPELPKGCVLSGNPRGQRSPAELRFEFSCEDPLTAEESLVLPWQREGVLLTATWLDGSSKTQLIPREGTAITVDLAMLQAGSGSWRTAAQRYLYLGVEHILMGIDHLLFVLAVLLMVRGVGMLVKTITAFTVAHSITLALATLGVISVPSRPVEAVIALSIVFVCVEIVRARQGRAGLTYQYPWGAAFVFGLLHGLGFAGALAEIGLPGSEIPLALLFFNIGVEIGQLAFVAAVSMIVMAASWLSKSLRLPSWRWARSVPVYAIGTIATYWFIERAAEILPRTF